MFFKVAIRAEEKESFRVLANLKMIDAAVLRPKVFFARIGVVELQSTEVF
jgi:hypothetical protein